MKLPFDSLRRDGCIHLNNHICIAYRDVLKMEGLAPSKQNRTGGRSESDTNQWFASNFESGAARLSSIQNGAHQEYGSIARHLSAISVTGRCVIFDLCCGSATASATMISNLIHQRKNGNAQCAPVTIEVHGWDYSSRALDLGEKILNCLKPEAQEMGIQIQWIPMIEDIANEISYAKLVTSLFDLHSSGPSITLMIGNISGEASQDKNLESRILSLCALCEVNDWGLLWYEPNWSKAKTLLEKFMQKIQILLPGRAERIVKPFNFQVRSCHENRYSSGVSLCLWRVLEEHGGIYGESF